jgi:hypothetical protein
VQVQDHHSTQKSRARAPHLGLLASFTTYGRGRNRPRDRGIIKRAGERRGDERVFPPDARLNPGPLSLACVIIQRNTSTSLFPAGKVDGGAPVQPKDSPLTPAHHHRYRHIRSARPARRTFRVRHAATSMCRGTGDPRLPRVAEEGGGRSRRRCNWCCFGS